MTGDAGGVDLTGKVAIVTGGARGMGEAEARRLNSCGASVVLTDVLADEGRRVADELGPKAIFMQHDVSDEQTWSAVAQKALEQFGRIDVLVNNAAMHWVGPIMDDTAANFRRVLDVNLVGTFLGIQAVGEPMAAGGGGSIVNVSSIAGLEGLWGHGSYGSSKWGVRGLSKVAAIELGPRNIRVNSIHPGAVDTPMLRSAVSGVLPSFDDVPLRRVGQVEEIAALVVFLASDLSSYINGAEIAVDGGSSTGPPAPPDLDNGYHG